MLGRWRGLAVAATLALLGCCAAGGTDAQLKPQSSGGQTAGSGLPGLPATWHVSM
jgi:hypothetical protein